MTRDRTRFARRTVLAITLTIMTAASALADTDYRCLSDCIKAGRTANVCFATCSYPGKELPALQPQGPAQKQSAYSPFTAPAPSNEIIVPGLFPLPEGTPASRLSPTTQPLGPSTNFRCVSNCLANGYQHGLCVQNCSY